jgi:oligopeptidase B
MVTPAKSGYRSSVSDLGDAEPPVADVRPVEVVAHGRSRTDEYAWLGDADDEKVLAYLEAERSYYDAATAHLRAVRERLAEELISRTPAADTSVAWSRGGYLYFTRTAEGEEHERLFRVDPRTGAEFEVLDPNAAADGSGFVELGLVEPSPDGRLLAYSVDTSGAELFELRFRDLETGDDLPDLVMATSYGGAWSADSATFLYTVPDASHRPDRVMAHRMGTPSELDWVVLVEPDRRFELDVHASRDGRWLVLSATSRDTCEVSLLETHALQEPLRVVARRRPGLEYTVEPMSGGWTGTGMDRLLVVTNDRAEEFQLMEAPVPEPGTAGDPSTWVPVPRSGASGERLESAAVIGRHVVLSVRGGLEPFLRVLDREPGPDGRIGSREVHPAMPCGQLRLWRPEDPYAASVVVVEENLVVPPAWVRVNLGTGARTVLKRTAQPGVDPTRYVTERIHAVAPDGTSVPVTIARARDTQAGGSKGCLLYGYGAYEHCSWPAYSVGVLSLLDRGAVYAIAHVRGGGELGRSWWESGRLREKQRTFDDFVAARDALVTAGWATPAGVISRGLSAGGLLQGAVYSQAPARWRAVIAEVPFVDVVTTMSDPSLPLTVGEWDEWGDPVHSSEDHAAMLAYSPYDNPPPPVRPPLLVTGVLNDPRVLVREPAKWVARLRATDDRAAPSTVLFRVELGDGAHSGPSGRFATLRYEAEILGWALHHLGLEDAAASDGADR